MASLRSPSAKLYLARSVALKRMTHLRRVMIVCVCCGLASASTAFADSSGLTTEQELAKRSSWRPSAAAEALIEQRTVPEEYLPPWWLGVSFARFEPDSATDTQIDIRTIIKNGAGAGLEVLWRW